jgi:hypothetical protein
MRRLGVIVALGALLGMVGGVVTAAPALAVGGRGDGWTFLDFGTHFTEDAQFCGFEIQGTQDVDNAFIKALKTADGSMIFLATGAAKITLAANGKSVSANVSGPMKIVVNPDGSTTVLARGPGPVVLTPDVAARLKLPGIFIFTGKATATLDADGNIATLSLDGHILVNVCAALS